MHIQRFLPQIVIALVVVGATAVGLDSLARRDTHTAEAKPVPMVLRWANEGVQNIQTLDPANFPDLNTRLAAQLIYGGLVRFGPNFVILPDAARSWTVSEDERRYTFTLRPNLRFADGSAVTAEDVAYSFNRTLNHKYLNSSGWYLLSNIVGASVVTAGESSQAIGILPLDTTHLVIQLREPDASFLAKLATPAGYIVSPAEIAADPQHWDRHAYGSGPFMVKRWVPNGELLLVPNPYYHGGRVRITGIDMPFIPEPLEAYKRYQEGAVDTMGTALFPTDELYNVEGENDFHISTQLRTVFLTLNERKAPFNNMRVRQALALAIDKREIVHTVYGDFATPTAGMLPPDIKGYDPHVQGLSFNPARARQTLAAAGYPGGRGLPTITYTVDQDAQSVALASDLASQWRRVLGIHVRLQQVGHNTYNEALAGEEFQLAVIDWTADYPDPANFLSQQLNSDAPNNNSNWHSDIFDQLVSVADRLPADSPWRWKLYHQAQNLAMQQAADIPLVNPDAGILLRRNIHGLTLKGGQVLARDWTKVSVSGAPL